MSTSLPFARFIQLIKAIDSLPVSAEVYNRHRMQYDYILGQLCLCASKGKHLTVSDLASSSILGSQPTAIKRLQELISFGLIESNEGEDRRQKILILTKAGDQYLEACSAAMSMAVYKSTSFKERIRDASGGAKNAVFFSLYFANFWYREPFFLGSIF